ncbi:hypothetical protein [Pseudovibrio ascidiaceicola]|uniref:hypothetical protein n=1 Tax=Pseudovibrio ascidiaceicola TaxID=285279 RepID=UPI000B84FE10|nr:hypothetical protein [Pseudovibrio ascidiaceicola]
MKTVIKKTSLIACVFAACFAVSGCLLTGAILPAPGYTEIVKIDSSLTNQELSRNLLAIFRNHGIAPCAWSRLSPEFYDAVNYSAYYRSLNGCIWEAYHQPEQPKVNADKSTIVIGDFPEYNNNVAGQSARFRRLSNNELEVTVKGQGPYYMKLPNKKIAQKFARIIKENLQ